MPCVAAWQENCDGGHPRCLSSIFRVLFLFFWFTASPQGKDSQDSHSRLLDCYNWSKPISSGTPNNIYFTRPWIQSDKCECGIILIELTMSCQVGICKLDVTKLHSMQVFLFPCLQVCHVSWKWATTHGVMYLEEALLTIQAVSAAEQRWGVFSENIIELLAIGWNFSRPNLPQMTDNDIFWENTLH